MSMNRSRAVMATDTSRAVNNTVGNASGTRTVRHAHRGMERTFHWTFFFDPLRAGTVSALFAFYPSPKTKAHQHITQGFERVGRKGIRLHRLLQLR